MIPELDEVSARRVAKYRQQAIEETHATLLRTFGDAVETALASPTARAAIERYIDTCIGLMHAHACFRWADMGTTGPYADAVLAYRDAQVAYMAAIEVVCRDARGATEH